MSTGLLSKRLVAANLIAGAIALLAWLAVDVAYVVSDPMKRIAWVRHLDLAIYAFAASTFLIANWIGNRGRSVWRSLHTLLGAAIFGVVWLLVSLPIVYMFHLLIGGTE